jgi:hypothetical protein
LVADVNCQVVKLLGQDNFAVAAGRGEIESTGDWASAMDAMMNTQNKTQTGPAPGIKDFNELR